jgi:pimeloyl-ACP methyl ester carboxylesterase
MEPNMAEEINHHRRRFFGTAALTIAAAELGMINLSAAQSSKTEAADLPTIKPRTNTSFGPLKQINAGVLNVGYADAGPTDGPAVILLHGWPYDIHTYVDVAPLLASAGYRVIVPYLRGYGTTRFLSSETVRNGQQSAIALDIIALMDALKIEKVTIGGCDWGARTACIIAALWPERCRACAQAGSGARLDNGSRTQASRLAIRQQYHPHCITGLACMAEAGVDGKNRSPRIQKIFALGKAVNRSLSVLGRSRNL